MKYYCLTIRKCTPIRTYKQCQRLFNDYENILKYLKRKDETMHIEYHYECVIKKNGKYNIHLHAMLKTRNGPPRMYKQGFSILMESCRSNAAWTKYITKQPMTKADIMHYVLDNSQPCEEDEEEYTQQDSLPIYKKLF